MTLTVGLAPRVTAPVCCVRLLVPLKTKLLLFQVMRGLEMVGGGGVEEDGTARRRW